ncbi:MAG: hypothetical protein WCG23_08005 [bacterium]
MLNIESKETRLSIESSAGDGNPALTGESNNIAPNISGLIKGP